MKEYTGKEVLLQLLESPESKFRCIKDARINGSSVGETIELKDAVYNTRGKVLNVIWGKTKGKNTLSVHLDLFTENSEDVIWVKVPTEYEIDAMIKRYNELVKESNKLLDLMDMFNIEIEEE